MGFLQEFREFALKGNALDMAVGLVLGAAFNKIVNSIVNDILMPPLGFAIGGVDFKFLAITLREATAVDGKEVPPVEIRIGMFLNTVIEFLIVAFSVFMVVKVMNRLIAKRPAAPAA